MRVREFLSIFAALALAVVTSSAMAQIVIKTSDGMGADAEVRESQTNIDPLDLDRKVVGNNRGDNSELASRVKDDVGVDEMDPSMITNHYPSNDRSSVMFMKFDLNTLPESTSSFWDDKRVKLRLFARNDNNIRVWSTRPDGDSMNVADYRAATFGLKGLDPSGTYNNGVDGRTDRFGNAYTADQYQYNWNEGDGSDGSGITYYNAPGLQPHCAYDQVGLCDASTLDPQDPLFDPNSDDTAVQTLGKYDDFDSNTIDIEGNWHWPNEDAFAAYSTTTDTVTFPAETEISYDGAGVKDLVLTALQAFEDNTIDDPVVTFMVYLSNDPTVNKPDAGRASETPTEFLNRNYLVVPKEYTNENAAMNIDNALDPALVIVPEPASASLVMLGLVAAAGIARRRRS